MNSTYIYTHVSMYVHTHRHTHTYTEKLRTGCSGEVEGETNQLDRSPSQIPHLWECGLRDRTDCWGRGH